jgi:hypothetical protein
MIARRRLLLSGAVLALGARAAAQAGGADAHLPPLDDLRALLAQVRSHRAPLLVLFSTAGCPYCREVRNSYLAPRLAEQAALAAPTLLIREVEITSRALLVDAQGQSITHAEFAARFGIRVVPVVALLDERAQPVGEPLVGIDASGFYEAYLARAIAEAQRRLRS